MPKYGPLWKGGDRGGVVLFLSAVVCSLLVEWGSNVWRNSDLGRSVKSAVIAVSEDTASHCGDKGSGVGAHHRGLTTGLGRERDRVAQPHASARDSGLPHPTVCVLLAVLISCRLVVVGDGERLAACAALREPMVQRPTHKTDIPDACTQLVAFSQTPNTW